MPIYLQDEPALDIFADPRDDVVKRHVDRYREVIKLAGAQGGRWLDIACGSGYGSALIRSTVRGARVLGIDRDDRAIEFARRQYARRRLEFECHPVAVAEQVYADARFDVIVSVETIEHLPRGAQQRFVEWAFTRLSHRRRSCLVLAFPLRSGDPSGNPNHIHEPDGSDVAEYMLPFGGRWTIYQSKYESTYGPATQAFVVGWKNKVPADVAVHATRPVLV